MPNTPESIVVLFLQERRHLLRIMNHIEFAVSAPNFQRISTAEESDHLGMPGEKAPLFAVCAHRHLRELALLPIGVRLIAGDSREIVVTVLHGDETGHECFARIRHEKYFLSTVRYLPSVSVVWCDGDVVDGESFGYNFSEVVTEESDYCCSARRGVAEAMVFSEYLVAEPSVSCEWRSHFDVGFAALEGLAGRCR